MKFKRIISTIVLSALLTTNSFALKVDLDNINDNEVDNYITSELRVRKPIIPFTFDNYTDKFSEFSSKLNDMYTLYWKQFGVGTIGYSSEFVDEEILLNTLVTYEMDDNQFDSVSNQIDTWLSQVPINSMTDTEKVKYVTDTLVNYLDYDESYTITSPYEALSNRKAVCEGYAKLTKIFLDKLQIPNFYLSGTAGGGSHGWNVVKINGQWLHTDTTWADPIWASKPEGYVSYNYFLKTDEEISTDHSWDPDRFSKLVTFAEKEIPDYTGIPEEPKPNTAPEISLENGITELRIPIGGALEIPSAESHDLEDGIIPSNNIIVNHNVNISRLGEYTVSYKVEDSEGLETVLDLPVYVYDDEKPVINKIVDTVRVAVNSNVDLKYGITASDNYTPIEELSWVIEPSSIDTTTEGVFDITYKVYDSSDNYSTTSRTFEVYDGEEELPDLDTDAPTISLSYQSESITAGDNFELPYLTINDNVDDISDIEIIETGDYDVDIPGEYTIIFRAKDKSGNISNPVTFTLTVLPIIETDTDAPIITIHGNDTITIVKGSPLSIPTVTAMDDIDGDVSDKIIQYNSVDINEPGEYVIKFEVEDKSGNKSTKFITVTVIEPEDTERPSIIISGGNSKKILKGEDFKLPKAVATDNIDGDLTNKIVIDGKFDVNTVGEYKILYAVKDNAGNETELFFTLIVVEKPSSGGGSSNSGGGGGGSSSSKDKNTTSQEPKVEQPKIEPNPSINETKYPIKEELPKAKIKLGDSLINIEGRTPISMDTKPFVDKSNRTMMPVKFISNLLNLNTFWEPDTKSAIFSSDNTEVTINIGSPIIYVNGNPIEMDTVAVIKDGRTFIPLKYLANAFEINIEWNNDTKEIEIN